MGGRYNTENNYELHINDVSIDDSVGYEIYTYDGLNELTGFYDSRGNESSYTYLPNHYRMSKTANGMTTYHIWDGENIVAESDGSKIIRSYVRGHQLLTDDERRTYMYDGHGNMVQQVKGSIVENKTRYDAFGNVVESSNVNDTPFGYCGEYTDSESGLVYLRNRYYDTASGRFITEDPVKDGLNWYAYCGGNPVMFWDPSGKIRDDEIEMYENGEMAPAAYSYLWKLTYNWWLADTEWEKSEIEQKANEFRNSGYTDTGYEGWNERIEKMDKKPSAPISEEEHFFRNELNITYSYEDLQKINEVAPENVKWTLYSPEKSALHQNTSSDNSNKKYVSADGHFEAVYTKDGVLLSETYYPVDMGTYNYGVSTSEHIALDIVPYYSYGGNVKDSGEAPFKGTYDYYIGDKLDSIF